jgi:hypothetical protein
MNEKQAQEIIELLKSILARLDSIDVGVNYGMEV